MLSQVAQQTPVLLKPLSFCNKRSLDFRGAETPVLLKPVSFATNEDLTSEELRLPFFEAFELLPQTKP